MALRYMKIHSALVTGVQAKFRCI